jgi:hypothetical protein
VKYDFGVLALTELAFSGKQRRTNTYWGQKADKYVSKEMLDYG